MKTIQRSRWLRLVGGWLGAFMVATCSSAAAAEVAVRIAESTTRITQPLREDGYPDYVAALNEICAAGVTADNNAAVPFMRAFGPGPINETLRPRFFNMLGIEPLPEEGLYLVGFDEFCQRLVKEEEAEVGDAETRQKLQDAYAQSLDRPWGSDEFPEVAAWVAANAAPLSLILEGTQRPRFYAPMIAMPGDRDEAMVISVLLPVLQELREAARLLKCRAMLRLQEGETDAAWQDLFACHRLGRLAAEDPTLIGALVGIAIDSVAIQGDSWIVAEGNLSEAAGQKILDDLQSLEAMPPMVECLETAERFAFLDAVCAVASGRVSLSDLSGEGTGEPPGWLMRTAASILVDWDAILRKGNRWYDRFVAAANLPNYQQRREAYAEIEADLRNAAGSVRDARNLWAVVVAPRATVSEQLGNVFVSLLLPALSAAMEAEGRSVAMSRMNEVSFALATYWAKHQQYPATLADLEEDLGRQVPLDPFSGEAFRYRREGAGFVIYSVGPNLRDDNGKVYYLDRDENGQPGLKDEWDDFRIRVPPAQ